MDPLGAKALDGERAGGACVHQAREAVKVLVVASCGWLAPRYVIVGKYFNVARGWQGHCTVHHPFATPCCWCGVVPIITVPPNRVIPNIRRTAYRASTTAFFGLRFRDP